MSLASLFPPEEKFAPTGAHRAKWSLATLGTLLLAVGSALVISALGSITHHRRGGWGTVGAVVEVLVCVFAVGASLGMATVPRRVSERGLARAFSFAMGFALLGLVLAAPTPYFCFTAPLTLLAWSGAAALFAHARRTS